MAKIFKTLSALAVIGLGLAALTGCPNVVENRPVITVTPGNNTAVGGDDPLVLVAVVQGVPPGVDASIVWSIVEQGTHGGTYLNEGVLNGVILTVSPFERHPQLTVRATLVADAAIYGQATVDVVLSDPIITGLTLTAASTTGVRGSSVLFSATVEGLHSPPPFMDWELVGTGHHADTRIEGGVLTIAAAETLTSITVRATSQFDNRFYAEDSVDIHDLVSRVASVSAGGSHTVIVGEDGSLWGWGNNEFGQVGDGTFGNDRLNFTRIGAHSDWVSVSAGNEHTMGIREGGSLWAWGNNAHGRTGLGTDAGNTFVPTRVGTDTWTAVSAGESHTLAIRSDGSLWAWGNSANGRTGFGAASGTAHNPVRVGAETDWVYVSAGVTHSLGIRENDDGDRTAWGWGNGSLGRLGTGSGASQSAPAPSGGATNWVSVSAGNTHSMGVRADGTLFATGSTDFGVFGGGWGGGLATPNWTRVGVADNWASVSSGIQHTMATRTNNTLWGTGNVMNGRVGGSISDFTGFLTTFGQSFQPGAPGLQGDDWASVSAGDVHTMGIRTDGSLWAWGLNANGRTGFGAPGGQQNFPARVIPRP